MTPIQHPPAQACSQCGLTLRAETDPEVMKAHLDSQHYHRRRFPVPEPYALLVELCIRPGQTAHQLADARGHRVTCRGRRLTYDACVRTALAGMLAAGTARYVDAPGGRGRAGFHRLWYAAVRP
jgi:hypothetical protein